MSSPPKISDPGQRPGALYRDPTEALQAVRDDYHYWTGKLTETSLQLSLGLIAANWAVFGTVQKLLGNWWAELSLTMVIINLALGVVGARWMSELHLDRIDYAADAERWKNECAEALGQRVPWPFTKKIEDVGFWMRNLKFWLPILAGAAFLIGLLTAK